MLITNKLANQIETALDKHEITPQSADLAVAVSEAINQRNNLAQVFECLAELSDSELQVVSALVKQELGARGME